SCIQTPGDPTFSSKGALSEVTKCRSAVRFRRSHGTGLTMRGYTPHHKVASMKISKNAQVLKRDLREKVDPEQISLLMKKEWKLFYVTPLYKFKHTQLKTYSKQLSAFIASEKQKGRAVEVGPETGFKVVFSIIFGLTETEEDTELVFIQIHSKPSFAAEGASDVVIWSGWLACINGNTEYLRAIPADFVCLPLFCASGAGSLTSLVKSWFETTFDCNFGQLRISPSNLHRLATMWTGCHPTVNIRYLKLSWTLPTCPPLDISYTVNPGDVSDLWSRICQGKDQVSSEVAKQFFQCLESHFFRHFRIHLSAGELTKVSTALGSAYRDGKIQVLSLFF
ncbi:CENPL protein, partial [Atractosteus spatula]|nr:CENPL protein [Atractosteus spatula]